MKKVYTLLILCTVFVCSLSFCQVSAFQEDSFDDYEYEQIGSLGLGHLVSDGQISELDFSNGSGDTGFLIALGKSIVTKDPLYVLQYGLDWATDKAAEILQSLENWFSYNFPRLYNFFTGNTTTIQYHAMPLETRKGFTHLLKDRVDSPDPIQPDPDVNYIEYIQLINGNAFNVRGVQSDFWLSNFNRQTSNITGSTTFDADPNQYTFLSTSFSYNLSYYDSYDSLCIYRNNQYEIHNTFVSEPVTIYINQVPDSNNYIVTTSAFDLKKPFYWSDASLSFFDGSVYYSNGTYSFGFGAYQYYPNVSNFQYTGSLENCFKIICINFRNVDIYVNGDIWSLGHFTSDDSIIYPIGIPDNFEILSGVQGGYYYPTDSYWNLDGLVQLIKQAITEYGVVSISDIAPLIVDINGVQAVRTTNVARTDYDNLISEQYSIYPDSDILKVPDVVLDNGEVISFVASSSGSDLIPDDIMLVLCGGGILLLIGYLINRMLE